MAWTSEQALALAPDPASAAAGRGLASPAKWQSAELNERAAWGEAKGSGAKPYQTVVSLSDGAAKCSCPSRKFPCKHALGLLLRVAEGGIPAGECPDWAAEWLDKRGQKKEAKAENTSKAVDPKTAEKRWANVLQGLDECQAFLEDVVAAGLISNSSTRSWDEMAARMVDAQAPGVARRLRRVGETIGVGPRWAETVAAELGQLALLLQAARNIGSLGQPLASDVRYALGIPARKEDLAESASAIDVWDVLGTAVEVEDRLTTCRTWLRSRGDARWALQLAFAPVSGAAPPRPPSGRSLSAEARFFPSAWPLRAHLEEASVGAFFPSTGSTWSDALQERAQALSHNPWNERFPVHLCDARVAAIDGAWYVVDAEGQGVPLVQREESRWKLLATTGNHPCNIFGELEARQFRLISAWGDWGFIEP